MRVSQSSGVGGGERGVLPTLTAERASLYHRKWLVWGHGNNLWFSVKNSRNYNVGKLRNG